MISIKYCPDCGKLLPDPPFYCNWCGSCLNKTCLKCELLGFSKYCTQCGSEMVRPNVTAKQHVESSKNHEKRIVPMIEPSKPTKTQNLSTNEEVTIKVKILKGIDMKEILLQNGGGCRHIPMSKNDSLDEVKTKIIDHYFCSTDSREKYSSLGSPQNYLAMMLDFKRDDLTTSGYFESLGKYLKHHGIKPNSGPSFYLHLLDKPKFQSTNLVEFNNDTIPIVYTNPQQQTNTIQTTQANYFHSFNKQKTLINELNEIHNTFLLKPTNLKQNHVSESIKLNSSLRETNSKLNQSTQNSSTSSNITYTKKPLLFNTPNKKAAVSESSSDSSSSSDSDSNSSTSTTVVNKKTIKRTNQEIKKMKTETSSPQKKPKLDTKKQDETTTTKTKVKNEVIENETNSNSNNTNKKKDNLETLCLTPNSSTENTLNLHVDQNEFKEDSKNNNIYNYKNYETANRRYNDYNNNYYRGRYDKDNSRSYSRYPNTRYSPSNYNSNYRYSRFNNRTDRSNRY